MLLASKKIKKSDRESKIFWAFALHYLVKKIFLSKKRGQVFLVDKNVLLKIEKELFGQKGPFLEIGAGSGNLTEILAKKGEVFAIECDKRLILILKERFSQKPQVKILEGDALFWLKKLDLEKFVVVGNIPYYLTLPILKTIFLKEKLPKVLFFTVQKEVGERICEKNQKSCFLSSFLNFFATPKILFEISRNSFFPKPKVDSVFLKLKTKRKIFFEIKEDYLKTIKIGYSFPRKTVLNNFLKKFKGEKEVLKNLFQRLNFFQKRPEDLKTKEWIKICQLLIKFQLFDKFIL